MEVIILAGGFGTRLQSVVNDVAKPMADINGKPFLEYLFEYLLNYKVTHVVLSVAYKKESIQKYFGVSYKGIRISYSCEDEPLGTGGAIKQALTYVQGEAALVLNGDTFFNVDLFKLDDFQKDLRYDLIISLKQMLNFNRYGAVEIKGTKIVSLQEKGFYKKAYINAGVYMITKSIFNTLENQKKFSFEEFLEKNISTLKAHCFIQNDSYFIDIGIPADYAKAKNDFKELF